MVPVDPTHGGRVTLRHQAAEIRGRTWSTSCFGLRLLRTGTGLVMDSPALANQLRVFLPIIFGNLVSTNLAGRTRFRERNYPRAAIGTV